MQPTGTTAPTPAKLDDTHEPADGTSSIITVPGLATSTPDLSTTPASKALSEKILCLEAKTSDLRAKIEEMRKKRDEVQSQLRNPDAAVTVRRHIKLLHSYNEIRDVGTGLMGMIADNRGVRIKDIYAEFGVEVKD